MKLMSMENYRKRQNAIMLNSFEDSTPSYSKYAIFKYLTRMNMWNEFKKWLESSGLQDYWEIPTQFSEVDEDFIKGVQAFKARFNLTDDQINTIKEECRI